MKKKKLFIILLIVLIILLVGFLVYSLFFNNKVDEIIDYDHVDTFIYNENEASGYVTVKGYVTVDRQDYCEGECETDENSLFDVVNFHIVETTSADFRNYVNSFYSDDYTGDKTFSLGCVKGETIEYYNTYDELLNDNDNTNDFKKFIVNKNYTQKILSSSQNNPITLRLGKEKFSSGSGAPECYSHITNIDILN